MTVTAWDTAWVEALDDLEMDVVRADALILGEHALVDGAPIPSFVPPVGLGPLPPALHDRACALLQRQIDTAAKLARAMVDTRQHMALAGKLEIGRGPARPMYVDSAC